VLGGGLLLGEKSDTLLGSENTDSLLVDVTSVLAGVDVGNVQRVAGELDTSTLNEVSVLGACKP
jgi:hypothetical protein